ncbi:adenylosuccinate lyase family protein [Methylocaldum sp.]|uniref:class-II fumarase/aspartase family protein n=1 Tax=Methylocaldum sp. TaxID=1969727 RepID=UPI002D6B0B21|nr:adenylosuccinate lyase family protein [Methylocaldum sp.]HYE34320.1 adenylosuccinate lyase family protein [Methylocaldum sp.]
MALWTMGSEVYGGAWSTEAVRSLFTDKHRIGRWLEILAVLAKCQAAYGLIPESAAAEIEHVCRSIEVNRAILEQLRLDYEATSHSTYGLIRLVKDRCGIEAGEWIYFGATVQDIADTWMMLVLKDARKLIADDLNRLILGLEALCRTHRETVMPGRTHGQQGLPITFGFKAASWLAEARRQKRRLEIFAGHGEVGQLGGAVGSLTGQGTAALDIQAMFCAELGLRVPDMSWTASRDLVLEWANTITNLAGTADRICREIYHLQRTEIDEAREGFVPGTIGSITMPHKRNPEISEHVGTLARVVRANAAILAEGSAHEHERDGRSWKAEWHAIPEITMAGAKAVQLVADLIGNLQVDAGRMRRNLESSQGFVYSEAVMMRLAGKIGRATAHRVVYDIAMQAREGNLPFREALLNSETVMSHLTPEEIGELFDPMTHVGSCMALVDRALKDVP